MGTWLVWVGSFGMRGADEAGCHRGDGSLVFYWCLSLLESGPGLCRFTQSVCEKCSEVALAPPDAFDDHSVGRAQCLW